MANPIQAKIGGGVDAWIVRLDETRSTPPTCGKGTVRKGNKCVKKPLTCKKGYKLIKGKCKKSRVL
jgi:hypothetical protein